jgi:hypothetical protein
MIKQNHYQEFNDEYRECNDYEKTVWLTCHGGGFLFWEIADEINHRIEPCGGVV